MAVDRAEYAAWLRLLEAPGLGRAGVRRLLAAFGSAPAVLDASAAALRGVVGAAGAAALAQAPLDFETRQATALAWLDGGARRSILTLGDPGYPPLLLQTSDPPLLLYLDGDAALLTAPSIAIVGSRNPSAQGADNARAFAAALSRADLLVVSGLAQGIDAAAHEGALAAGAPTLAVVGSGPDIVYPRQHRGLSGRIAGHGLLVSEYAPGTPPLPLNFPQRNRIIAGLTRGTLVVEAALRSGSLITARLASEAGREVFAIPGSIHLPQARGCHALIRQGAKLVESSNDILEELGAPRQVASTVVAEPGANADPLLDALGQDPTTLDALAARTGWSAAALNARLLELELDGKVGRLPGGLFQRRGNG